MKKHWLILLLLVFLIGWAIAQAQKTIVTAIAIATTVAALASYTFLWPIAVLSWLVSLLWGSDFLRGLFGLAPKSNDVPFTIPGGTQ